MNYDQQVLLVRAADLPHQEALGAYFTIPVFQVPFSDISAQAVHRLIVEYFGVFVSDIVLRAEAENVVTVTCRLLAQPHLSERVILIRREEMPRWSFVGSEFGA